MNTSMQTSPCDTTARATFSGGKTPSPRKTAYENRPMSRAELEEQDGIKAQHCVAAFIINYLAQANTGWSGQETEVGGSEDRQGIDFYLINEGEGRKILVDFSFASKGGEAVKLEHDWFVRNPDGSFSFLVQHTKALLRRFIPRMSAEYNVNFARQ